MFYYDKHKKKKKSSSQKWCLVFVSGLQSVIKLTSVNFHNADHQTLCSPFTCSKRLLMTLGCHMST